LYSYMYDLASPKRLYYGLFLSDTITII
jgi:hypothetical protein